MKQIIVRENRIPLIIGIIDTVVFLIFLFFSIRDGILNHDNIQIIFCGFVFGGFAGLGIVLIMESCLRKVVIGGDECYYRCFYGRKIFFQKDDIAYCKKIIKNMETQYCLYNKSHKKIASFEENMINSQSLIAYLYQNNIPIKTMASHTKKKEFNQRDFNDIYVVESRWSWNSFKQIKRTVNILKYISFALMVIGLFVFHFRYRLIIFLSIPLFWYMIYVWLYPVMFFEIPIHSPKHIQETHIRFPVFIVAICIIFLMQTSQIPNIQDEWRFYGMMLIIIVVLLLPFFYVYMSSSKKITRLIGVVLALFVYSFSSCYGWNWVCSFEAPIHEKVQVIDWKETHGSKSGSNYYLYIHSQKKRNLQLECSKTIYEKSQKTGYVILYQRESFFGIKYWDLH